MPDRFPLRCLGVVLLLASLVLVACSGVRVARDYDPTVDFSALSGWQWLPRQESDLTKPYDLTARRVEKAIGEELAAKGYAQVQDNPDFYVTFRTRIEEEVNVDFFYDSFGYMHGPWWAGYGPVWGPRPVVTETEKAIIVVDLVQPGQAGAPRELVWRGIASYFWDDGASPAERMDVVREAIQKLFEDFPPS